MKLSYIVLIILCIFSVFGAFIYGVMVGDELRHYNSEAFEASRLTNNIRYPEAYNQNENSPEYLNSLINEKIITFGQLLQKRRFTFFIFDRYRDSSITMFLEAARYRIENPMTIEGESYEIYSPQHVAQLKALVNIDEGRNDSLSPEEITKLKQLSQETQAALLNQKEKLEKQFTEFKQVQLEKIELDSYYYNLAMEYAKNSYSK